MSFDEGFPFRQKLFISDGYSVLPLRSSQQESPSTEKEDVLKPRYDPLEALPVDIVFGSLFSVLSLSDKCTCRQVSRKWKQLMNNYLGRVKALDFVPFECTLTAYGLKSVVRHVRNLQVLRLDTCWTSVDEEGLAIVAGNCPKLRVLTTCRCKGVTDNSLKTLAKHCKEIEELDFSSCFQISDEGILEITQGCKNLAELYVSSCYGVTDKSVESLATCCHHLRELDISWCYQVTDLSLRQFLGSSLQSLRIKSCARVSHNTISQLVAEGIIVNYFF